MSRLTLRMFYRDGAKHWRVIRRHWVVDAENKLNTGSCEKMAMCCEKDIAVFDVSLWKRVKVVLRVGVVLG